MTRTFSLGRVGALLLRHFYLLRGSPIRIGEIIYLPTVQMLLWGFVAQFLAQSLAAASAGSTTSTSSVSGLAAQLPALLIAGVLLWEVLFRAQVGVALSFLEEIYARNLGHLFVTPLRMSEWIAALFVMGLLRTVLGVGVAAGLAFAVHRLAVVDLGWPLLAFFANLIVLGWAFGLIACALVLRYGVAAENFAWGTVFAIAPLCGIYYPVATLPGWVQPIAYAIPASHVFEGMRAVAQGKGFIWHHFWAALGLNAVYMVLALVCLTVALASARKLGLLLQTGD
jgi:ABC-2 type transport system permease protein